MFCFEDLKRDIPKEHLERLIIEVREEFPHDEMMFELHLLRAIKQFGKLNNS